MVELLLVDEDVIGEERGVGGRVRDVDDLLWHFGRTLGWRREEERDALERKEVAAT